jgi:predicted RNase H-like HicB family nuclease
VVADHSITLSARCRNDSGMVSPIALADLRLSHPRFEPRVCNALHPSMIQQKRSAPRGGLPSAARRDILRVMKLTAIFEPAKEGGYTCFVEEVPAAISQGETLDEAKANLLDALKLVLECQRELVEKDLSPNALREPIDFIEA